MQPTLTHAGVVYPWQCDHNGHMNVMWYVGKFDEATWTLFAGLGITPDYLRQSGCGLVAVEQSISYKKEFIAGDTLSIHSRLLEAHAKSLRFEHVMRKNGEAEIAATTSLTGVHIDLTTRRSRPFPINLSDDLIRVAERLP